MASKEPKPRSKGTKLQRTLSSQSTSKASTLSREAPTTSKKLKPLSVSKLPLSTTAISKERIANNEQSSFGVKNTGNLDGATDDQLWIDMYEPVTEADLAVHKRKVEDVRRWLSEAFDGGPGGKWLKYRRLLVLTGPAGSGKTTTVRILARELGFDIVEWRNSVDEHQFVSEDDLEAEESLVDKFDQFLGRAAICNPLSYSSQQTAPLASSSKAPTSSSSSTRLPIPQRQIILLEDLPNVLHPATQKAFHDALSSFASLQSSSYNIPLVIIISDAGTRGEMKDERLSQGGGWGGKDVLDIRSIIPKELLGGPYVTQISFNPIAPTLLQRALQSMVAKHFPSQKARASSNRTAGQVQQPSKEIIDIIVQSSNGDIRNAVMALQFACFVALDDGKGGKGTKGKKKVSGNNANTRAILEAMTRREQSLALFHMLGKVLYNKRKYDPPSSSATNRDKEALKELDLSLKDPPPLPEWLSTHERKASRVDIDALYADSPVDSGLFSLYIHQNYTQFCNELEECEDITDWLSWIDSSGGEHWYQANPHQFHLLTLSTLHSLPCPVPRNSQKIYKPEFFDILKKTRSAEDAVEDVKRWLAELNMPKEHFTRETDESIGGRLWSDGEIILELGAVLKALAHLKSENSTHHPHSHQSFSKMVFQSRTANAIGSEQLEDNDDGYTEETYPPLDEKDHGSGDRATLENETGGWLEDDDIEEG